MVLAVSISSPRRSHSDIADSIRNLPHLFQRTFGIPDYCSWSVVDHNAGLTMRWSERPPALRSRSAWLKPSRLERRSLPVAAAQLCLVRRMHALLVSVGLVTPTATPESAHFPEDPILVLRDGWGFLLAYYIFAAVGVLVLWRVLRASRLLHSAKGRVILAALLAAVFTPSEMSDLFLFNLPGPAAVGFFMLLIGLVFAVASNPLGLLNAGLWWMVTTYYLLPLLGGFAIAYSALWLYHRSHPGPVPPPNQSLQPTADRLENYEDEIKK